MKTGFSGTFVISWTQIEIDGQHRPPVTDLTVGTAWSWTGEAVRVDGPSGVLPLGASQGEANIRSRAAQAVRKLLAHSLSGDLPKEMPEDTAQEMNNSFRVTNGANTWTVTLIDMGEGRDPLCMFIDEIPPRQTPLWVVDPQIDALVRQTIVQDQGGVVCFTPGTMILTPDGVRDIASLEEGDLIQTADNGSAEILWLGQRRVSGARMHAMPSLRPIQLREGALGKGVPDAGLLVSPDHRIVLRGSRARELYNADEVLVTARDLIDDHSIVRDFSQRQVTYVHMMLSSHQIVFANGVATESFHPGSAELSVMEDSQRERMYERMPSLRGNVHTYGDYARRVLSDSEAAILRYA